MPSTKLGPSSGPARYRGLRKAMVCSVSQGPHGLEVVVRLNAEQWLVACPHDGANWQGLIGRAILVDPCSQPIRLLPPCRHVD